MFLYLLSPQLKELALTLATQEQDFELISSREIVIPQGASAGSLPVTIMSDDLPELNETFSVSLVGVQVLGVEDSNPSNQPTLVGIVSSTGVIKENDDPYGRFVISGNNMVPEPAGSEDSLPVTLTIRREAGTNGDIEVTWSAEGVTASADDFSSEDQVLVVLTLVCAVEDIAIVG